MKEKLKLNLIANLSHHSEQSEESALDSNIKNFRTRSQDKSSNRRRAVGRKKGGPCIRPVGGSIFFSSFFVTFSAMEKVRERNGGMIEITSKVNIPAR